MTSIETSLRRFRRCHRECVCARPPAVIAVCCCGAAQMLEKHGLHLQAMSSENVVSVLRGVKPPTKTAASTCLGVVKG